MYLSIEQCCLDLIKNLAKHSPAHKNNKKIIKFNKPRVSYTLPSNYLLTHLLVFGFLVLSIFPKISCQITYFADLGKVKKHQDYLNTHSNSLFNVSLNNLTTIDYINYEANYSDTKIKLTQICTRLKNTLKDYNNDYSKIKGFFPFFISGIRSVFKTVINVALKSTKLDSFSSNSDVNYFEWLEDAPSSNQTKTNSIDDILYSYTLDNIFLIFPTIFIVLFVFLFLSIINCLYCKFCYCGIFAFSTSVKKKRFFHKITIAIIMFTVLTSICLAVALSQALEINKYSDYFICELVNKPIITFLRNYDYTQDFDNPISGSQGLMELRNVLNKSNTLTKKDQYQPITFDMNKLNLSYLDIHDEKNSIETGLEDFQYYVANTDFFLQDSNSVKDVDFFLNYTCNSCKNYIIDIKQKTNDIINYFSQWADSLNDFYQLLSNKNNDGSMILQTSDNNLKNDPIMLMNKVIFLGHKYLEETLKIYSVMTAHFTSNSILHINFSIIAILIGLSGIYFQYISYKQELNTGEIEQKKQDPQEVIDIENIKNEFFENKKLENGWKRRKAYHVIINFSMFIIILFNFIAFSCLYYSLLSYDLVDYVDQLYDNSHFQNFKYFPYGDIVDECRNYNFSMSALQNYFGLNKPTTNPIVVLDNIKLNEKITSFYSMVNKVIDLSISDFKDAKNSKIFWDNSDDQINYFLFPLKNYIKITEKANETLQQYTDWNFISKESTKFTQKDNCSALISSDVYTASEESCLKYFPSYKYFPNINFTISQSPTKSCFSLNLTSVCEKSNETCFINTVMNRYKLNNTFSTCNYNDSLDNNQTVTEKIKNKMISLLSMVKVEFYLKDDITKMLNNYKLNFLHNISNPVALFKTKLEEKTEQYKSLIKQYPIIVDIIGLENNYQISNINYENYMNCKLFDFNNTFSFGQNLISSELYGIGLFVFIQSLMQFIIILLNLISYFNLLSPLETVNVVTNNIIIKGIEEKERNYFMSGNFIDDEDLIFMNIKIVEKKKEDEEVKNKKEKESENDLDEMKKAQMKAYPIELDYELKNDMAKNDKSENNKEEKKVDIIKDFIKKHQKRVNRKSFKKIDQQNENIELSKL